MQYIISDEKLQKVFAIYAKADPKLKLKENEKSPDIHSTHFLEEDQFKRRNVKTEVTQLVYENNTQKVLRGGAIFARDIKETDKEKRDI
jgi:hypothetical protein